MTGARPKQLKHTCWALHTVGNPHQPHRQNPSLSRRHPQRENSLAAQSSIQVNPKLWLHFLGYAPIASPMYCTNPYSLPLFQKTHTCPPSAVTWPGFQRRSNSAADVHCTSTGVGWSRNFGFTRCGTSKDIVKPVWTEFGWF